MQLETERLVMVPLTSQQLDLWINDIAALEQELNCRYQAEPMEGIFLEIVKHQAEITRHDPDNYCFHSFWLLVRKTDRKVIGSADFKDLPNKDGVVEIGYGLGKDYEHQGYMTEAVRALCQWAFSCVTISQIIAETDLDGYASQRILIRCGFIQYRKEESLWWKLERAQQAESKISREK